MRIFYVSISTKIVDMRFPEVFIRETVIVYLLVHTEVLETQCGLYDGGGA